jgi:hypothetical protein
MRITASFRTSLCKYLKLLDIGTRWPKIRIIKCAHIGVCDCGCLFQQVYMDRYFQEAAKFTDKTSNRRKDNGNLLIWPIPTTKLTTTNEDDGNNNNNNNKA